MSSINCNLLAAMIVAVGVFTVNPASAEEKSDPTSATAWSAGNVSGAGNFMSYCLPCHGPEGKGDGVLSESLDVKPRDLSNAGFLAPKPDEYLFKVVKTGGTAVGLTENMPPFVDQLSDEEIVNIVAYLRKEVCKCEFKKN
ncbi:MAG: cytochrome c [Hyphomicrobiales bacterium]|nr:cytochrome c [Hyphomicrobiales bacterium]